MTAAGLYGLVLAGGRSRRMQRDKASIAYGGRATARAGDGTDRTAGAAAASCRCGRTRCRIRSGPRTRRITDLQADLGPMAVSRPPGTRIRSSAWLVIACDLPFLRCLDAAPPARAPGAGPVASAYPQPLRRAARTAVRDLRTAGTARPSRTGSPPVSAVRAAFLAQRRCRVAATPVARARDNINALENVRRRRRDSHRAATDAVRRRIAARRGAILRAASRAGGPQRRGTRTRAAGTRRRNCTKNCVVATV